jgi:hypothetical protein
MLRAMDAACPAIRLLYMRQYPVCLDPISPLPLVTLGFLVAGLSRTVGCVVPVA